MLLVHLLAGGLLLREARLHLPRPPGSTELRLIRLPPPPLARAAPPPTRMRTPAALPVPASPNAITLPAVAQPAAEALVATPSPAASAAAPAPLDLRLPARMGTARGGGIADQIRADGRANSPRVTLEQRLAGSLGAAMGNGKTEVIEGVQGGRMIRGPNGECTLIRPSMMQEVDPGNERWRLMPSKTSDCSNLQPGARRHERPK